MSCLIHSRLGGDTDTLGRIMAERMAERLGVAVVVANVPGGSGTVGSDSVRRAEPDGYTLLFNASLFLMGKHVVKSTPYDPQDDFTVLAPQTKGGRVRGFAITGESRSLVNPDIPTTNEAGMPGLSIASWYGVWGPKGMPAAVTNRLGTAVANW